MWLVWPPPLLPSLVLVGRELDVACVATAAVAVTGIVEASLMWLVWPPLLLSSLVLVGRELDVACVAAAAVAVVRVQ